MKKYILSVEIAIITLAANYGEAGNWTFGQFIFGFLVSFFTIYHLEILNNKKY